MSSQDHPELSSVATTVSPARDGLRETYLLPSHPDFDPEVLRMLTQTERQNRIYANPRLDHSVLVGGRAYVQDLPVHLQPTEVQEQHDFDAAVAASLTEALDQPLRLKLRKCLRTRD